MTINLPDRMDRVEAVLENLTIRVDLATTASTQRMDRIEALLNKSIDKGISDRYAVNERMDRIERILDVIATSLGSQNQQIQKQDARITDLVVASENTLAAVNRLETMFETFLYREGRNNEQ